LVSLRGYDNSRAYAKSPSPNALSAEIRFSGTVVFPVMVFFEVFFQKIDAKQQDKGVVNLSQQRDEIGKDVNGAENIDDGQNKDGNGSERNIAIFPFPVIFYQCAQKLEILKQPAPQTDFEQIVP
jgi:hypothetical protein